MTIERHSSDQPSTIPALIRDRARGAADAPAFFDAKRTVTYGELARTVQSLTQAFRSRGARPGDRIVLFLEGTAGIDGLMLSIAAACAGAAVVLSADAPKAWRARMIERVRPALVVLHESLDASGIDAPLLRYGPGLALRGDGSEKSPDSTASPVPPASGSDPDPEDIAIILPTSGTTGEPRLVPMPHRMVLTDAGFAMPGAGFSPDDRLLLMGAPHHAMALWAYTALWHGSSTVVAGLAGPDDVAQMCVTHRPTVTGGSPTMLAQVGDRLAALVPGPATSFRLISTSGAAIPSKMLERITRGFRCRLIDEYGASEALSISANGILRYPKTRIADDTGSSMPAGVAGEIQTQGPHVFPGYFEDPVATAAAFTADGWFRTGDLGVLDDNHRLTILGRISERINRAGVKISPMEIEQAAISHPLVADAAAYPIDHPTLGQDVGLAVVLSAGTALRARTLRRWLLDRLPAAHMPRVIRFVDDIPRNASGKVARAVLASANAPETSDAAGEGAE